MKMLATINSLRRKLMVLWCVFVLSLIGLDRDKAAAQSPKSAEIKAIHLGLVSEINKTAIEEHFRETSRRALSLNLVLFELAIKRGAVNAKQFSGFGFVALSRL